MTDRPIIFSAPMVRAMLEGRKTQTRRVLRLAGRAPDFIGPRGCERDPTCWGWEMQDGYFVTVEGDQSDHAPGWRNGWRDWVGAYSIGDRLWVREAHAWPEAWDRDECEIARIWYPAGTVGRGRVYDEQKPVGLGKTRPSIHMPRWASRLTLIVTDVRVQRLNELTDADAISEGIMPHGHAFTGYGNQSDVWMAPYDSFASLWNSLHGPEAWAANPWVCALTFRVIRANIDSPEAAQ